MKKKYFLFLQWMTLYSFFFSFLSTHNSFASLKLNRTLSYKTCFNEKQKITELFQNYLKASKKTQLSKKTYPQAIKDLESYLIDQNSSPCASEIYGTYAILSFKSLVKFDPQLKISNLSRIHSLLELLLKEGKLIALTPEMRKEYGGIFSDETEDHRHHKKSNKVLGAYDCTKTTLYFDPFIAPLNLGAVISHELDHLLRDKKTYESIWAQSLDKETKIILDEVLANIMGAFTQLRFASDIKRSFPYEKPENKLYFYRKNNYKIYAITNDFELNLYQKNGPLVQIWFNLLQSKNKNISNEQKILNEENIKLAKTIQSKKGTETIILNDMPFFPKDYNQLPHSSESGISIFGEFNEIFDSLLLNESEIFIKEIIKIVSHHYFKNKTLTEEDLNFFVRLIQKHLKSDHPYENLSPLKVLLSEVNHNNNLTSSTLNDRELEDLIFSVSKSCEAEYFISSSKEGGRPSENLPLSKEGGRPAKNAPLSKEGGRPSENLPLSKEGGRPAKNAPLSKEGGRPALTIKPCISINRGL